MSKEQVVDEKDFLPELAEFMTSDWRYREALHADFATSDAFDKDDKIGKEVYSIIEDIYDPIRLTQGRLIGMGYADWQIQERARVLSTDDLKFLHERCLSFENKFGGSRTVNVLRKFTRGLLSKHCGDDVIWEIDPYYQPVKKVEIEVQLKAIFPAKEAVKMAEYLYDNFRYLVNGGMVRILISKLFEYNGNPQNEKKVGRAEFAAVLRKIWPKHQQFGRIRLDR